MLLHPLDIKSQFLFALEWTLSKGWSQQLTCTVSPQGFRHSSHLFAQALGEDLTDLQLENGALLQYVGDLFICSPNQKLSVLHAVQTLNFLATWEHKLFKPKAHLVKQEVHYLGLVLTPGRWGLSPGRVQATTQLPEPSTRKQLRACLGLSRFMESGYLIMASLHSLKGQENVDSF